MKEKGVLLFIDDEELLRETVSSYLKDYADKVLVAEDAIIAQKILKENTVHCILCDIQMPHMNGIELLIKLREEGCKIPFIFYTGHGTEKLMLTALSYGAFDFLDKPYYEGLPEVVSRGLKAGLGMNKDEMEKKTLDDFHEIILEKKPV